MDERETLLSHRISLSKGEQKQCPFKVLMYLQYLLSEKVLRLQFFTMSELNGLLYSPMGQGLDILEV